MGFIPQTNYLRPICSSVLVAVPVGPHQRVSCAVSAQALSQRKTADLLMLSASNEVLSVEAENWVFLSGKEQQD